MTQGDLSRRDRVNKIKKILFIFIPILIISLLSLSIFLGVRCAVFKKQINALNAKIDSLQNNEIQYDDESGVYSVESVTVVDKSENVVSDTADASSGQKKVYLTFDDGPSLNTGKILDTLDKYGVKATFFVVKKDEEKYLPLYNEIVERGHTLALHSYSHKYSVVYESMDSFAQDITSLQEFLYENTGVWPRIYRFPGGSSNTVSSIPMTDLIEYLNEQDITYFDWNISSEDAQGTLLSAETIANNCLRNIDKNDECVILMHDLTDRTTTVKALDIIIPALIERGDCTLLPITDETVPVQHIPANINHN